MARQYQKHTKMTVGLSENTAAIIIVNVNLNSYYQSMYTVDLVLHHFDLTQVL